MVDFYPFSTAIELDVRHGYLDKGIDASGQFSPQLVLNRPEQSMLRVLREELVRCDDFLFSVAFVTPQAITLLKQELADFQGRGCIVTSDYLGFNSPEAFAELYNLTRWPIDVRLHNSKAFHSKGYLFEDAQRVTAILGSSNLTGGALVQNHEWNLKVGASKASDLAEQIAVARREQLANSQPLTLEWIEQYAAAYEPPRARMGRRARVQVVQPAVEPEVVEAGLETIEQPAPPSVISANAMQEEALREIALVRDSGEGRALVISATGTGKTILSALDVRAVDPSRLLFVVHREQIIDRAIEEYERVLGAPRSVFGKVVGGVNELDRRYVFASIQSISRPERLASIAPDTFDYIIIDEVHRAGAESYRRLIDHFSPRFLLGMTATPERSDGFSVFELFDYNVPYEIRLNRALESNMLAPFHYFGVADVTFDDGQVLGDVESVERLSSRLRIDHIIEALETYGHAGRPVKGLMFCSRVEEAERLSDELNLRTVHGGRLRTVTLSGKDSLERRERVVEQLENGEIDYILTVDIFNEGVDIPSVNQVVMLRQTQSAIIFVQQLGRGLRKAAGKDYVTVIDFIGNYANNYLIPIALFGDDSLNKESLRKNLIAAEERGVLAGLSSIRFDRIAQERVLRSLVETRLDSMPRLRAAVLALEERLGRTPLLADFLRFESVDPIVLATRQKSHYPGLLASLFRKPLELSDDESRALAVLSNEVLPAKRLHDLVIVRALLEYTTLSREGLLDVLEGAGLGRDELLLDSVLRILTLDFHTEVERTKYGSPLIEVDASGDVRLTEPVVRAYRNDAAFRVAADDVVATGIQIVEQRYAQADPFVPGLQYSRKDACRLLGWTGNMTGTVYGYKVDRPTKTCPIFITYHKSDEISASTAYEDELLDRSTLLWYTRSRRTLESQEVKDVLSGDYALHVFAKTSDAEGSDFYYLGRADAGDAEDTTMPGDDGSRLRVVRMHLKFREPIQGAVYDYFHPSVTSEHSEPTERHPDVQFDATSLIS